MNTLSLNDQDHGTKTMENHGSSKRVFPHKTYVWEKIGPGCSEKIGAGSGDYPAEGWEGF